MLSEKQKKELNIGNKIHILKAEYDKFFEKKTMLELQIALQKKLDPDEISAKKPLRLSQDGKPISYQDISRKEYITILEKDLENVEQVLETIEEQY